MRQFPRVLADADGLRQAVDYNYVTWTIRAQMARLTGRTIPTSSRTTRRIATSSRTCIRPSAAFCPGWPPPPIPCSTWAAVRAASRRPGEPAGRRSPTRASTCRARSSGRLAGRIRSTSSSRPTAPRASRLPTRYADVVSAVGWLHWEPRYAAALAELWRLTGRYAFFDLRLVDGPGPDTNAMQRLALTADWDGRTTVPYICASWPRVAELLARPRPGSHPRPRLLGPARRRR